MSFRLIWNQIFGNLSIEGKRVEIISLEINTSPPLILKDNFLLGWRPANKKELSIFAEKYKPATPIYGIEQDVKSGIFGPMVIVYQTKERSIQKVNQSMFYGLPNNSLILFIKDE